LGGRGALTPLVDANAIVAHGSTNYANLASPSLNRLLDAAAAERDPVAQLALWREAETFARSQAAVIPLAFLEEMSLIGPEVRGFEPHPYFLRGDPTAVWVDRP
ncbi:MAG: hypothetical protein ACRDKS_00920, partial [Actinomycetota bacterium]